MAPSHAMRARTRARAPHAAERRAKGLAILILVAAVALLTGLLTAFGSSEPAALSHAGPAPADRLLPAGPPRPQVIALQGALRLQLPIPQERLTVIGYHSAADGALALHPLGSQANVGLLTRLARRVFGGGSSGLRWYQLDDGEGPATAVLDVGAPTGTDVYSPVDGTVVGITDEILSGRRHGVRIDIEPTGAPSLVVSVTHLRADPALAVGSTVAASSSKIGTVLDFSQVERQALARYTQDAGNHVSVAVRPAATLAIP